MKICFFSLSAYPLFNSKCSAPFGGAEVQLFNFATELAKRSDLQVDFITGDFGQCDSEVIQGVTLIKSVKVEDKRGMLARSISIFMQLHATFRSNADIYVQRSAGVQTGLLALFCLAFGKRFVYMTAHDWDCDGGYVKENGFIGKIYGWGLRHAHVVIAQSDKQKLSLSKCCRVNSVVLKSGYDISIKKSPLKDGSILWVARLNQWKQPEVFLNLAKQFPEKKFIMIAPVSGDELYSKEIGMCAKRIGNLTYIKGLPFQETEKYFAKSAVFVNTSKYEGFPNTFVQALMYNVPILSLAVNPDRFLDKYSVGYCAGGSFQNLVNGLLLLTENKGVYEAISKNTAEYVEENHNIKMICEDFLYAIGLRRIERVSARFR